MTLARYRRVTSVREETLYIALRGIENDEARQAQSKQRVAQQARRGRGRR